MVSRPEQETIICCMAATELTAVEGAIKDCCSTCNCSIWVAPSSRNVQRKYNGKFLCEECTSQKIRTEGDPNLMFTTPEQIAELRRVKEGK